MFFKRKLFFNIFLLIFLAGFLTWPNFGHGADEINSTITEHLQFPDKDTRDVLNSLFGKFIQKWENFFTSSALKPEEEAIFVILKENIRKDWINYSFVDAPIEVLEGIIKLALKVASLWYSSDISTLLDKIEKMAVQEAVKYGENYLLQKELRIASGAMSVNEYKSCFGNPQKPAFQYLIIYKPISTERGEVRIEIYSPNPIEPPPATMDPVGTAFGSPWSEGEWQAQGNKFLSPFIIKINGTIEKSKATHYLYDWVGVPTIEVTFSEPVPDLGIKPLTFWERQKKKIEEGIKETVLVLNKLFEKTAGAGENTKDLFGDAVENIKETAGNALAKIKSILSQINPFKAAVAPELKPVTEEIKEVEEEITALEEEIAEAKPPEAKPPEAKPVGVKPQPTPPIESEKELTREERLAELQEKLDDIAEEIDIIGREVAKLVATYQSISKGTPETIPGTEVTGVEVKPQQPQFKEVKEEKEGEEEEIEEEEVGEEVGQEVGQEIGQKLCEKISGSYPVQNKVIFNEIAWMGTTNSVQDEWIEVKNISNKEINLGGWQLLDKDNQIKIIFFDGDRISNNGFLLLERTDDNSAPNIPADKIYTGAINDANETLYLFDSNCQLQDEAIAGPDWQKGDNSSKRTMERKSDLTWQTSLDPGGTPKRENSSGYFFIEAGGGGIAQPQISLSFPQNNPVNKEIKVTLLASNLNDTTYDVKVSIEKEGKLLSEIYNKSKNEWQSSNYYLKEFFSGTSFSGDFKLKIKDEENSFRGEADIFAKIRKNGKTTIYAEFKGKINIIDPEESQTESKQNQSPTASFTFSPKNPFVGEEILFDASSSTDPDGQITSFSWDFGDGNSTTTNQASTTYSYLTSGTSTITLLVTDNRGAVSSFSTIILILENPNPAIPPNHILITEAKVAGNEEFIELYNPTDEDKEMCPDQENCWYLSYFSSNKDWNNPSYNKSFSKSSTTTIPAKGHFLIGFGGYNEPKMDWKADGRNLKDENGAIGIFSCNPEIATSSTTTLAEAIEQAKSCKIDVLGWGEALVKEGDSASSSLAGKSLARKVDINDEGHLIYVDTDNNKTDFEIQEPTPKEINKNPYSDLDNDGVIDSYDPETIVSTSIELEPGEYSFKDLSITDQAKLILNSDPLLEGFQGVKIRAENLYIATSSSISADDKGFPAEQGPGCYQGHAAGGSYGGKGAENTTTSIYGNVEEPIHLGSGGGNAGGRSGGAGGGIIYIKVENNLILNGFITTNGQNGKWRYGWEFPDPATGAGSGGSIYIETNTLTGSGLITANGGNADSAGPGGGGRIAIYYSTNEFDGKIQAYGGQAVQGSAGGPGTIYLKEKNQSYGDLVIDNNNQQGDTKLSETNYIFNNITIINSARLYLPENLTAENIQVENNATLEAQAASTITVNGQFMIDKASSLIGPSQIFLFININNDFIIQSGSQLTGDFDIQTGNLIVATSSSILADGKGYPSGQGLGKGEGGSYGGKGGGNVDTSIYGSVTEPKEFGSGGGGFTSENGGYRPGGAGGGAIIITLTDVLTLDGTISANGGGGQGMIPWVAPATGGGSGGSVYIEINIFQGSGLLTANGGNADTAGAGGGGRVGIYYSTNEFNGEIQSYGGQSLFQDSDGGPGTIYLKEKDQEGEVFIGEVSP